jgi:hypothetical protein
MGLAGRAHARCPCFGKPAPPVPHSLFRLFYLVEIRHRQLLQSQSRTRSRMPMPRRLQCEYGDCMIIYLSNPAESNGQQADGGTLIESRGLSARQDYCRTQSSSGGALREKARARITFQARLPGRVQLSRLRRWPRGFAEPKPSRRISHVTCETKKLNRSTPRKRAHLAAAQLGALRTRYRSACAARHRRVCRSEECSL